jgi:hypothetical protein
VIIYLVVAGFVGFGYYLNDSNAAYAQQEIWMDAAEEGMAWPYYIWQFIKGEA